MRTVKHFPSEYKTIKNGWLTAKIFRQSMLCLERKIECKNRNILLLCDQCSAPVSTTRYLKPLDQVLHLQHEVCLPEASSMFLAEGHSDLDMEVSRVA
jgi:hypothetical protein